MLEELKNEFNKTETANGDLAFTTTKSYLLDFFSRGGAMRNASDEEIIKVFSKAYSENKSFSLKALFYFRDIRGGQGERNLFKVILKHIAEQHSEQLHKLLPLIPEYGRWDDVLCLLDTNQKENVALFLFEQLGKDVFSEKPSLLAKWLPSENASSSKTKEMAKYLRNEFGQSAKEYRIILSELRAKIKIVETAMSNNEFKAIDYSKVPSKAMLKYRKAFHTKDGERFTAYLDSVEKGETKINTGTIYPYEIYTKVRTTNYDKAIDQLWKNLPDYVNKDENALVMADVSGSMTGMPMAVSVSLALYFAERNKGKFANHFMTFSESPNLVEVVGSNVFERMANIERAEWGMNTDLRKAMLKILQIAIDNKVPQEELPKKLYIISDMQFDRCCSGQSSFQDCKRVFASHGYELPEVVFWNVNGSANSPVTMNEHGVQLVSGCSPVLFKQIVSGLSAYDLMMDILGSERYKLIE